MRPEKGRGGRRRFDRIARRRRNPVQANAAKWGREMARDGDVFGEMGTFLETFHRADTDDYTKLHECEYRSNPPLHRPGNPIAVSLSVLRQDQLAAPASFLLASTLQGARPGRRTSTPTPPERPRRTPPGSAPGTAAGTPGSGSGCRRYTCPGGRRPPSNRDRKSAGRA